MGAFDYNTANEQRDFDLIPDNTIVVVEMHIREGNASEDGLLKRSKSGEAEGIDVEFIVIEGAYAKRKVFAFMVLSGTTQGHAEAAQFNRDRLRAILESVRGIKPTDVSEAAKKARLAEFRDFDGIRFIAKLGVEKGKDGYRDKNILKRVITPDQKEWHPIEQVAVPANAKAIVKPAWAQ
jgi:hypothetical protein